MAAPCSLTLISPPPADLHGAVLYRQPVDINIVRHPDFSRKEKANKEPFRMVG